MCRRVGNGGNGPERKGFLPFRLFDLSPFHPIITVAFWDGSVKLLQRGGGGAIC